MNYFRASDSRRAYWLHERLADVFCLIMKHDCVYNVSNSIVDEKGNLEVQLNMAQKWLGHANIKTTAIYSNAVGQEERNVASRLWE